MGRTVDADGNPSTTGDLEQTVYVFENGQVVLQFEKTDTGNLGAGDLSNRYLWGAAVDQLLADEQVDWTNGQADGETLWALTDHLGTVRDLVDDSGALQNHKTYDAFGNVTGETNAAVDTVFGYTGKLFDDATGLQNNWHRWYDAKVGRWMSEDWIRDDVGNSYRYVGNAATGSIDDNGLEAQAAAQPPSPVPGKTIGKYNGVTVLHYGTSDIHKPAHVHLKSGKRDVRIGPAGKPLEGQPELNHRERACYRKFKNTIQKELRKVGRANARIQRYHATLKANASPTARALGVLGVYMTLRDGLQASGIAEPDFSVRTREVWHFLDDDANIFVVESGWFGRSNRKRFVAGPRSGECESITPEKYQEFKKLGETVFGKYIPGSLFSQPRFIPGSQRSRLPVFGEMGEIGYIDEDGYHEYPPWLRPGF